MGTDSAKVGKPPRNSTKFGSTLDITKGKTAELILCLLTTVPRDVAPIVYGILILIEPPIGIGFYTNIWNR